MTPVTRSHVDSTIEALIRERDAITQTIGMLQILRGVEAAPALPAIGPSTVDVHPSTPAPAATAQLQLRRRRGRPRKQVAPRATRRQKRQTPVRRASVAPDTPRRAEPTRVAPSMGSGEQMDATQRRAQLFTLIDKSAVGLTGGELRYKTPHMSDKDRQNSLSRLKELRRAGNTWVRVRPSSEDAES